MRRLTVVRSDWRMLQWCGVLFGAGVITAGMAEMGFSPSQGLLVSSFVGAVCYFSLLRHHLAKPPYWPSPLTFLLAVGVVRVALGGMFIGGGLALGYQDLSYLGMLDTVDYLLWGQAALLSGDALLIGGYLLVSAGLLQSRSMSSSILGGDGRVLISLGLVMSIGTVGTRLFAALFTVPASIGHAYGWLNKYGLACAILFWLAGLHSRSQNGPVRTGAWVVVWTLLSLETFWQLQAYLRQGVLITIVPIGIFLWWRWADGLGARRRSLLVCGLVILVAGLVLWPYAQLRRADYWRHGEIGDIRSVPVAPYLGAALEAAVPGSDAFKAAHQFPTGGFWSMASRAQVVTMVAGGVALRVKQPKRGEEMLGAALRNLIPRFVWPNKPIYRSTSEVTAALGSAATAQSATSSSALGLAGANIWMFGPAFGLMLMFVFGSMLALLWHRWHRLLPRNPIALIATLALCVEAMRYFESVMDAGASLLLFHAFVLMPLALVWKFGIANGVFEIVGIRQEGSRGTPLHGAPGQGRPRAFELRGSPAELPRSY